MFGHINYSRIQTLWVANSRRESLITLKLHIEPPYISGEDGRGFIEQVAEFSGIKSTIHFVILTADSDPHGDEAHAACVAAKIPPGELALAFSVHSLGVDQILIRKEWYDLGLAHADSSSRWTFLCNQLCSLMLGVSPKPSETLCLFLQLRRHSLSRGFPPSFVTIPFAVRHILPRTSRMICRVTRRKSKWWAKGQERQLEREGRKQSDSTIINDSALGQALTREIKKTEDSLHTKIGKLIGKEMDKQRACLFFAAFGSGKLSFDSLFSDQRFKETRIAAPPERGASLALLPSFITFSKLTHLRLYPMQT